MIANVKTTHRLAFFTGIGIISTLVHVGVVALLVSFTHLHPLTANIIAFFTAFNASYFGHRRFTFAKLKNNKRLQLPHFLLVAMASGLLNEYLYYLFLHYTHLHYLAALCIVVSLVAGFTFTASRFWACR
ncbi:MAG: putative GtrA-like protein [Gammaproteobacteria bacterium]|jgi:putative flippase GtrA|nr:putative GtrA-like protein [Gammaproteobacteria bacterium]